MQFSVKLKPRGAITRSSVGLSRAFSQGFEILLVLKGEWRKEYRDYYKDYKRTVRGIHSPTPS